MGYEAPATVYELDFADTHPGLEVAVRATTIDEFLHIQELLDGSDSPKGVRGVFGAFAEILVSWSVTKGGVPVPTTLDGLLGLEEPFVTAIVLAWQRRILQAPPPLPGTSSSGGTSPEAALKLAESSRSPENF